MRWASVAGRAGARMADSWSKRVDRRADYCSAPGLPCRHPRPAARPMTPSESATGTEDPTRVRHFRQILLWPLRLMPLRGQSGTRPWELLAGSAWHEEVDEYTGDTCRFHERHYNEFVTFLPYVQRFLYGEGRHARNAHESAHGSPMRVFRRHDIAAVRLTPRPGDAPVVLSIVDPDLYLFLH